ncbi:MAG: hypothetical protein ACR652_24695 [Methylocystis sp.]|uniref:hypothetical protein n=1 Tax=Methylocystis sp. TaxID=1911079 RepID=UPI003DA543CE
MERLTDPKAEAQFKQMQRALQGQLVPRTVTAAATLQLTDYLVACDATSAGFTLSLPPVIQAKGMTFLVVKVDSSANAVTLDGNGSETINGATTQALSAQWAQAQLYCDGSQWIAFLIGTAAAQPYTPSTWTPTDASGAGLTFTTPAGTYEKIGRLVIARFALTYPATADATAAQIGGLPFTVANNNAARQGFVSTTDEATLASLQPQANGTTFFPITSTGGTITNATLSGNVIFGTLIYPAA